MKKITFFLIVVIFSGACRITPEEKEIIIDPNSVNDIHVCKWAGLDGFQPVIIILKKDSFALLKLDGKIFGDKDFIIDGVKAECKYEIDYSKKPIWLDIVFYEAETKFEFGRFKGIVKFLTNDKMIFRVAFEGERKDKFDMKDLETNITLKKVL